MEIEDPDIGTYVAVDDGGCLVGFAATIRGELLHFGTAIDTWGDGAASELLGVVVGWLRQVTSEPTLRVFADNGRARRFYDRHGWTPTGAQSVSSFSLVRSCWSTRYRRLEPVAADRLVRCFRSCRRR